MKKRILISFFLAVFSTPLLAGGDLVVKVLGVNSSEGIIRLGLYDQERHFRKEKKAITVREALASTDPVVFTIRDLPDGEYGIYVFHDTDSDHKFDKMLGLFPSEGYGFSVNSDLKADENFDNSRFVHGGEGQHEVTVYMRYCGSRPDKSMAKTFSCWLSLSP